MVGASLLAGTAGVMALGPGGPGGPGTGSPATTIALDGDAEPIAVCTRASLEDRAALLLVVGLPGVTSAEDPLVDELAALGVGGVMLRDENITGEEQAEELVAGLRARLGSDVLVAVDDEGGRVSSMGELDQRVRSARRLGQEGEEAAEEAGEELGELAASIDVDWVLAPVADLDDGPASGVIGDRSFGGDPEEVAATAGAFARGLQRAGVAVTVKHFPGHGLGRGDPHRGDTIDRSTLDELRATALPPFKALIDDGADTVMVGHVIYPEIWDQLPASLNPGAYALLREQGFEGVAVTDALGMGAVQVRYGFSVAPAMAVLAGADAVLVTQGDRAAELHEGIVTAVRDGWLDEDRVDEAVGRVLALREQSSDGTVCPA